MVRLIEKIPSLTGLEVIYPIHPRTKNKLEKFGLKFSNVKLTEPLGYIDFLKLQMHANMVVTDSGGIQEEACILGVPCITIRENTERPETLDVGSNKLVGLDIDELEKAIDYHTNHKTQWENPFGNGKTSEKIIEVIESHL